MSQQTTFRTSPPRAQLAFRVGIVGHRPDRLPQDPSALDALGQMLRLVLSAVKSDVLTFAASPQAKRLYAAGTPILRAASPLAEGTDRIFAEEAIGLGYDLLCPMPFAQSDYESDFLPPHAREENSLVRFRGLLKRAGEGAGLSIFELDGERAKEAAAYGAAGSVVLNQSDLLVAVWDGKKAAGGGGTVQTLHEAIQFHVPVLWINANPPLRWQLLRRPEDLRCLEGDGVCTPKDTAEIAADGTYATISAAIQAIVAEELNLPEQPPEEAHASRTVSHAEGYFAERKPWFNFAFVWKLFRDAVADVRLRIQCVIVPEFIAEIARAWPIKEDFESPDLWPPVAGRGRPPSPVEDWVNRRLRVHYAWADKRGDIYADNYRSAYVLIYLLSATAVFLALLPKTADWAITADDICGFFELAVMGVIVALIVGEWTRHWHERWMEYRLLAELIRQLRLLIPLGGGRPFPHAPVYRNDYDNLNHTWMYWHMRAIARATGIPPAKVNPAYVQDCIRYVAEVVDGPEGQLGFHKTAARRSERIAHRLHLAATVLFAFTFVSIVVHLTIGFHDDLLKWVPLRFPIVAQNTEAIRTWLVLAAATLPALGAALSGIANQGEFVRLGKRSAAMANTFEHFADQIRALPAPGGQAAPKLSELLPIAQQIGEAMVDEVADWRTVVVVQTVRAA